MCESLDLQNFLRFVGIIKYLYIRKEYHLCHDHIILLFKEQLNVCVFTSFKYSLLYM